MALDDLLAKLEREAATPDTLKETSGYQGKALPLLGCTPETPDTPQESKLREQQAEMLADCPDALAAEPIDPGRRRPGERLAGDDDRRACLECANLRAGTCIVARPGGLVSAVRGYRPSLVNILQRCAGYSPNASDTEQLPGRERWPGLTIHGKSTK